MSDKLALPKWRKPKSIEEAKRLILGLGKSMHEHACLVGQHLRWVKDELPHGEFIPWIEKNLWFTDRTARALMAFSVRCEEAGKITGLIYDKSEESSDFNEPSKLPSGKYRVLYADPPWAYSNSGFNQSAESQYPTKPTEWIAALPVGDLIDGQAALFLWVTSPILPDGLAVMSAWGFEYKACFIWDKGKAPGMGWWLHTKHEIMLIGSRGDVGTPKEMPDSVLHLPPGKHSEKPAVVRSMIELMFPGPYIELFARQRVEGWDAWGNQVPQ